MPYRTGEKPSGLEHARWRVSFFRSILKTHLDIAPSWRDAAWQENEALYRRRLQVSEEELRRVEKTGLYSGACL
jgi:hypothetical protein